MPYQYANFTPAGRKRSGIPTGEKALAQRLIVRIAGNHVRAAVGAANGFPLLGLRFALGQEPAVGLGHFVIDGAAVCGAKDDPQLSRSAHELLGKGFLCHADRLLF